ncbi:MAG TPA: NADH-quinone oxidoreductase subunit M [Anaerolineales bacterium]|nr:NADH-quinone oxidoreductase subunit M [Anaerolineales bacterium]
MDLLNSHLLSLILLTPVAGALVLLLIPRDQVGALRWTAFIASLVPLALSVVLWLNFQPDVAGYQFREDFLWFPLVGSEYRLGVDGVSLPMVLLTALLAPLGVLFSFGVQDKVKAYMILFLLLETGSFGVFMALDLLLFFLFYEIGLIPMYFLINIWGSANKQYASFKFMLYTMAGSLGLLLATQVIGLTLGSFSIENAVTAWPAWSGTIAGLSATTVRAIAFWAFVIAFAIKVPIWPFHTWLPDAHTEAPTAGSMMLAGVLLKLGAYGFLRLVLPLYPVEAAAGAPVLATLATIAIVAAAFASFGQSDFKRLVAYSSVNHMGFVALGVAVAAWTAQHGGAQEGILALNGAVLQMFNHGLSAAGMFLLVGVIYDRTHTRNLDDFGGLMPLMPVYGGLLLFTSMASLGLPGLNGFVSEFMVVRGAFPVFSVLTAISMVGLLMTGAYILYGIYKTIYGPLNTKWVGHTSDISVREVIAWAPLGILMLVLGLAPNWMVSVINAAVARLF